MNKKLIFNVPDAKESVAEALKAIQKIKNQHGNQGSPNFLTSYRVLSSAQKTSLRLSHLFPQQFPRVLSLDTKVNPFSIVC